MSATDPATIGIDVGGTSVRAALVDAGGRLRGPLTDVPRAGDLIGQLRTIRAELDGSTGSVAGIAVPGSIDPRSGRIGSAPTAPALVGLGEDDLDSSHLCNDANAALLAEWRHGAAAGVQNVIGLFSGTGVGGGVIVDGSLLVGARGLGGELGHLVLDPAGPVCGCGGNGCLEQFASGTAIARWYAERTGNQRSTAEVARAARAGDAAAAQAFAVAGGWLGVGAAGLANIFNPEMIVVGGGVAAAWDLVEAAFGQAVRVHTMPMIRDGLQVRVGELGRAAGVIGAAAAARHGTTP
ncbi:ROK family protein [Kribbella albertanoniae]|uniref:ROK family protein n=1 Tax=Kribbella albertanoniae TaxID=1266829 RepID=A0A4R4Q722_9ACTN|nr:ROK family protein [Kribbella albertanoniae]TDC30683.1 ROK family protein [Kribbella albertanoniae]